MRKLAYLILILLFAPACDEEQLEHRLTVIGGEGSGIYRIGEAVNIQADPAPDGQGFFRWTGDTAYVQLLKAASSTILMPLEDITVQATYKDLPKYELTVNGGSGSGSYLEGAQIPISAELPGENFVFTYWTGDTLYLDQADTTHAVVHMPAQALQLTANYEEMISGPSFTMEIWPIIQKSCTGNGCHSEYSTRDKSFKSINSKPDEFWDSIKTGYMPMTGSLSTAEKNLIKAWLDSGANDN